MCFHCETSVYPFLKRKIEKSNYFEKKIKKTKQTLEEYGVVFFLISTNVISTIKASQTFNSNIVLSICILVLYMKDD